MTNSYNAITIDTQVLYANGRSLNDGIIAELSQYKESPIQVLLTEVVLREIQSVLIEKAKSVPNGILKALKDGEANRQLTCENLEQLRLLSDSLKTPKEHAAKQIQEFIEASDAVILPAESIDISELMDAYFNHQPPFGNKGKKSEFPDAIALMSLEAWAIKKGAKVLAVSNDGDWKSFAEQSNHIDLLDDLATAMSCLTEIADKQLGFAKVVLSNIATNESHLNKELTTHLESKIELETPYVEFSSSMPAEYEYVELKLAEVIVEDEANELEIVRVVSNGFVMSIPATLHVSAAVDVGFSVYDSIDKDYISMGSEEIETNLAIYTRLLIECAFNTENLDNHLIDDVEITNAQIMNMPSTIDIGYIDYSLAEPDEEYDASAYNQQD